MRFEDKEVDGPDLELAQDRRESDLVEEDEEAVPAIREISRPEELAAESLTSENVALAAMREILEHRHIVVNDLQLPQKELRALEALKAAVDGKDGELSQFVYASDRRDLLEQALAVLQPKAAEDLSRPFADLVQRIGVLRHDLKDLEDAQDNLLEANQRVGLEQGETPETTDKPKPKPDDDVSLDGPERKVTKPPTSLIGERPPAPKLPSTLDGPALPPTPPAETTVGSKQDLAAAKIAEPQRLKTLPFWKPRG